MDFDQEGYKGLGLWERHLKAIQIGPFLDLHLGHYVHDAHFRRLFELLKVDLQHDVHSELLVGSARAIFPLYL